MSDIANQVSKNWSVTVQRNQTVCSLKPLLKHDIIIALLEENSIDQHQYQLQNTMYAGLADDQHVILLTDLLTNVLTYFDSIE